MAGNGSIIIPNIRQLHENDHASTSNVDYSSIRGKVRLLMFISIQTHFMTIMNCN